MFEALQSLPKACPQDAAVLMEITTEYDEKMLEDWYVATTVSLTAPHWPIPHLHWH